jgi:hypothetical protein
MHATSPAPARSAASPDTGLRQPWRTLAHGGWILVVLLQAVIFVTGVAAYYGLARVPCTSARPFTDCFTLPPSGFQALGQVGLSPDAVAAVELGVVLAVSLLCFISGALIAWRKWNEGMGLFVSLILIAYGATGGGLELSAYHLLGSLIPWAETGPRLQGSLWIPAFGAFLLTFPTGRFTPRGSWLVLLLWTVPFYFVAGYGLLLPGFFVAVAFGSVLAVQLYRYRRVYGPVQRQQSKWLVLSIALAGSMTLVGVVMPTLTPTLSALVLLLIGPQGTTSFLPIAIAVAIALLHYRLYDIDVLINRALIYGSLSVTLALVYFAVVVGAQATLQALTGQTGQQPVFIVASTLLVAALFTPLRRRIQALVDQRFYRRKYDAAKTLAGFGSALRTETDLAQLSERLVAVVEETMQPSQVSLWLAPRAPRVKPFAWQRADAAEAEVARLPKPVPLPGLFAEPEGPRIEHANDHPPCGRARCRCLRRLQACASCACGRVAAVGLARLTPRR